MGNIHEAIALQGREARGELHRLDVPEWGDAVYYYESISVEEWATIYRYFDQSDNSIDPEGILACARWLLRDATGALLFAKDEDWTNLRENGDVRVILRILTDAKLFAMFVNNNSSENAKKH